MSENIKPLLPSIEQIASSYEKCYEKENRKVLSIILNSSIPKLRKWIVEYRLTYLNQEGKKEEEFLIGKKFSDQEKGNDSFRVLQYLWENGMGTDSSYTIIRPIAYYESCMMLLMTKASGESLKNCLNSDDNHIRLALLIASWLRKLHSMPVAELRETKRTRAEADITRFYQELTMMLPEKGERLKALYDGLLTTSQNPWAGKHVMLHGDFHLENLFVDNNQVTAIDFDHHFSGDAAWDVAYLTCQLQVLGFLKKGDFQFFKSFIHSFIETYLLYTSEQYRLEFFKRISLYRARSLFESLHYELCVLHSGNSEIGDVFLHECENLLKGVKFLE
ncbi:aminoglycoside phosphotransferase family protein [Bacillus sp. JJ1566]|uniref:phosphotransferase family protein n=1 Tax=Bacillus sp. JJ1566 TaxID=3122961 RepID=UPI003000B549